MKRVLTFGKGKVGRDFWALENINLEVEAGTSVGILGRNGAGKSTLLKLISGVVQPTSGTVRVNGRLVALLQLGAGFNEEFTGRENIMLNGLILGIERKEMLERFDEIEAFTDIGEFIDQPLKTYSSGMRARLGFAVAVNVKPDILLVDESLATGDAVFRTKGIKKMEELRDSGATILFVSHGLGMIKDFCTEAALLHEGRLMSRGDTSEVIDHYQALVSKAAAKKKNWRDPDHPPEPGMVPEGEDALGMPGLERNSAFDDENPGLRQDAGGVRIQNVELLDEQGRPVGRVAPESELTVRMHVQYTKAADDSVASIALSNDLGLDIFSTNTVLEKTPVGRRRAGERVIINFTFRVQLKHGSYNLAATVSRSGSEDSQPDWDGTAATFKVSRPSDRGTFAGLVHLLTRVEIFEPDQMQEREPSTRE